MYLLITAIYVSNSITVIGHMWLLISEVNVFFGMVSWNEIINCLFISEINTLLHYRMVILCDIGSGVDWVKICLQFSRGHKQGQSWKLFS